RPLGAITRVTLKVEGQDEVIEAEVPRDDVNLHGLQRGATLFFKPKAS
ncbi:MAG: TOBE domain-containing protein, partial [Gammaproteobacteria bacterium]|nr:TOBE domain-containing protein [Gammaproteobacteria bacterium]